MIHFELSYIHVVLEPKCIIASPVCGLDGRKYMCGKRLNVLILLSAAASSWLQFQPLSRLWDSSSDEGEAMLRRLRHRTGAEVGTGDDGASRAVYGMHCTSDCIGFLWVYSLSICLLLLKQACCFAAL